MDFLHKLIIKRDFKRTKSLNKFSNENMPLSNPLNENTPVSINASKNTRFSPVVKSRLIPSRQHYIHDQSVDKLWFTDAELQLFKSEAIAEVIAVCRERGGEITASTLSEIQTELYQPESGFPNRPF